MPRFESPYTLSPFRLLGVWASASGDNILAAKESWNQRDYSDSSNLFCSAWLNGDIPEKSQIEEIITALDDCEKRVCARIYWFHCCDDIDEQALLALRCGDPNQAQDIWHSAWEKQEKYTYLHNLAIFHHCRALAKPRGNALLAKDLQQCVFCWGGLNNYNCRDLCQVMLDGEDIRDYELGLRVQELAQREYRIIYQSLTRLILQRIPQLGGFKRVRWMKFTMPMSYQGLEFNEAFNQEDMVRSNWAIERARACARRLDTVGMESALEEARCLNTSSGADKDIAKAAYDMRLEMLRRDLLPSKQPHLTDKGGLGLALINFGPIDPLTRSYEGDLVFRLGYIPLWFLGRFRVGQSYDEKLTFLGKLPISPRLLALDSFIVMVALFFVLSMTSVNFGMLDNSNRYCTNDFDNGEIVIYSQELKAMRGSLPVCKSVREKTEASLVRLQERNKQLESEEIPRLQREMASLPSTAGEKVRNQTESALESAHSELKKNEERIEATRGLIRYIKDLEAQLQ